MAGQQGVGATGLRDPGTAYGVPAGVPHTSGDLTLQAAGIVLGTTGARGA